MTIKSSFFNSVSGDRIYDASDFASYFASFIGNGVFPNPSNNLQVLAVNGNVLRVSVSVGQGFINGYYALNDAPLQLQLSPADGNLSRIDRVVLALNTTNREITAYVKTGALNSNPVAPALVRNGPIYELALGDIRVSPNTTSVTQANITDTRPSNELCGFVSGVINQVDTTTLFNQYQEAFNEFTTQQQQDFTDWLAQIEAQLDGNTAGNLQNQINTKADINSPTFTGDPKAPTVEQSNSSQSVATTSYVRTAIDGRIETIEQSNTTATWIRLGTLRTTSGSTTSKLSIVVDGLGVVGQQQFDTAIVHFTTKSFPLITTRLLYANQSTTANATRFGWMNNASTGNTELWMRVPANTQNITYLKLGVEGGSFDTLTKVTTEPVGIAYSTPVPFTTDTSIGTLSQLLTTNKTNLVGSINELFTSVSNGKNSIAAAITSKGVPSQGSDTFAQLTNNINAIQAGARIASGTVSVSSNKLFFTRTLPSTGSVERNYITVSGLSFFPNRIVVTAPSEVYTVDFEGIIREPTRRVIASTNSANDKYEVISQQGNVIISSTGFQLPVPNGATAGQTLRWTAYSQ